MYINFLLHGNDHFEIHKFDGFNFALWKNQILKYVDLEKACEALGEESKRPKGMANDDREELDLTIILYSTTAWEIMYILWFWTMTLH